MQKMTSVFANLERFWRGDAAENLIHLSKLAGRAA
jgi:hypothetical protein